MSAVLTYVVPILLDPVTVPTSLEPLATCSFVLMSMKPLLRATTVTQMPLAVILRDHGQD